MSALQFEAVKVALKQDATGYVLTVKVHPDEIPEELLRDFVGSRYGIAMVRINDDETTVSYKTNRVQRAGIVCRDPMFQQYVVENFLLNYAPSEKTATHHLYNTLGIASRTELNGNKEAQDVFDKLMIEFADWRNNVNPF
jgi:hypothetical protein